MKLIFFIFICVFSLNSYAQIDSIRIKQIEDKLYALEEKLFKADSLQYSNKFLDVKEWFFAYDKMASEANFMNERLKNDMFFMQIVNVNNPTTINLQNRILQEMQSIVEKKVLELLGTDSTKKRGLFNTIRNIFKNPIVNKVLGLVPFGNTITGIISTLGGIIMPELDVKQTALAGIVLKSKEIDIKTLLDNGPLAEVSSKILPYLKFYDTLNTINNKFIILQDAIKSQFNEIAIKINQVKPQVNGYINLGNNFTEDQKQNAFNEYLVYYKNVRNNPKFNELEIIKVNDFYSFLNPIAQQFKILQNLNEDYEQKLFSFKKDYINILESFKNANTVFADMLGPIVEKLKNSDQPKVITAGNVSALYKMPLALTDAEKRAEEELLLKQRIERKYGINRSVKAAEIKEAIF